MVKLTRAFLFVFAFLTAVAILPKPSPGIRICLHESLVAFVAEIDANSI
jgi:hypothetical protein